MKSSSKMSRRKFFGNAAVLTVGAGAVVSACAGGSEGGSASGKIKDIPFK